MRLRYFVPLLAFVAVAVIAYTLVLLDGLTLDSLRLSLAFGLTVLAASLAYTAGVRIVANCDECRNYVARSKAPREQRPSANSGMRVRMRAFAAKFRYFAPMLGFVAFAVVVGYVLVVPSAPIGSARLLVVGYAATIVVAGMAYLTGLWVVLTDQGATT